LAKTAKTTLVLPNDVCFLHLIRAYVRELAVLAKLHEERTEALVLAADEACTNIMEHAFEPGETGTFTLDSELTPSLLTLAIRDQGLPFDPDSAPIYGLPDSDDPGKASLKGLGFHLIQQAVDEARWIQHGPEGKELRLVVYLEQKDVTEQLPDTELLPFGDEEPRAPNQTYEVRKLRDEEAIQVSRCIYRAYGYSYPVEDLYYPERIVPMNEYGQLISAEFVAEAGEVVGHYALERPDLGIIAESGQAVVIPAHRGRGLMQRMRVFLKEEALSLGLQGIFGQPVTSHAFSQRVNERFGSKVAGLTLALIPRSFQFKRIRTEPLPQRESVMLYFRSLGKTKPVVVHRPDHHKEMLGLIYEQLDRPAEFREGSLASGKGAASVQFKRGFGAGFIRIIKVGTDTFTEVRRAMDDLCDIGNAEVIHMELPLAQAGTASLCDQVENLGFFFSGIGPCFDSEGDTLRLQFLNTEFDMERLQIFGSFGRRLTEYISSERDRVSGTRTFTPDSDR